MSGEKFCSNTSPLLFLSITLLLLGPCFGETVVENLVQDASFETIAGQSESWQPFVYGYYVSSNYFHSGSFSLSLNPFPEQNQGAFQHISSFAIGRFYSRNITLCGWIYVTNMDALLSKPAIHLEVTYDEDGREYYASPQLLLTADRPNEWMQSCVRMESDRVVRSVTIFVLSVDPEKNSLKKEDVYAYVDDISLYPKPMDFPCGIQTIKTYRHDNYTAQPNQYKAECFKQKDWNFSIVTQLSVDRLYSLQRMASLWKGPISAAILVDHEGEQLKDIVEARESSQEIKNYVDFHVVFRNKGDDTYPVNVLRNMAIENCRTKYMIHLDIDFITSPNLYQLLESKKKGVLDKLLREDNKQVFVLPGFESEPDITLPQSKEELIQWVDEKKMKPVHINVHNIAHRATNYSHWYSASKMYQIAKFEREYEPYILSTSSIPSFDPRFKGYGNDKSSFFVELDILQYKMIVFSDVWVVHVNHPVPKWKGKTPETILWKNWYSFLAIKQNAYGFPFSRYEIISKQEGLQFGYGIPMVMVLSCGLVFYNRKKAIGYLNGLKKVNRRYMRRKDPAHVV